MKGIFLIALNILTSPVVYAKISPCETEATKIVTTILRVEEKRNDIGVEIKNKNVDSDELGTVVWFDLQGIYLKNSKKVGELPKTFSRVEFSFENHKCTLASYSMPLAN